ncbi:MULTISPECIES: Holliday junction resolvase RuvX [Chromohalobacter]|jgi:putative Holliday junction resolvase|uniref:Putative pre-16S rRNA nuclease n=1 Tax=Chromohalobacter israelensis (strain ATCC BAA-138 / DSM 3043 / CIP 106854 / NCIMB 13768 / 1H11) TaxID=290398 RepID=YQGF_CHRI1|nr:MULTISPECIES: Holliday junction resolvase RuvX [Chromohalobacter]Q1R1I5.1 RecName: Full=Putative pre-16S rRNA nuclease [Chromohalobacter salexigens DSM 3043]ABE57423.1 Holliday junction resolvase YqgF [Chromohalobacter salexigens DSM 3043]MDF9435036.1 Holliday junction resolvase RuvX [Chromohalobacter israelensis]NQY45541.1 Holliday junction resolvase RuvX [Chromohalobacter sp.]NWO55380.1 Holliday junction resolvase RuvX [Chromohalobacter salexigens]PWW42939.1 putative Holliday junction re
MAEAGQRLVLAFDFGTRRIGVAVGNEMLGSATALAPLPARDGIPDWQQIAALLEEWQPDLLVVGLPLNMDGTESDMSRRARKFGNRLHGRFGKPVEVFDERGSTRAAKRIARDAGHRGNYRDDGVDGIAAQLILESFFADDTFLQRMP